jgi:predicted RNA-binding Zn ribbon-like protein
MSVTLVDVDLRPYPGEPLPLDLLNTEWRMNGEPCDQLGTAEGARAFIADHGMTVSRGDSARAQRALREARAVVRRLVEGDPDADAIERGRRILRHGRLTLDAQASTEVHADDDVWTPAVRAVLDAVDLLATHGDRVRSCAHPDCVLWFLDTSRSGARRWHSMTTCGNRTKARRHYERSRDE